MSSAMMRIGIAISALALPGCFLFLPVYYVSELKPEAAHVRLVSQEPEGCTELGDVSGSSRSETRNQEAVLRALTTTCATARTRWAQPTWSCRTRPPPRKRAGTRQRRRPSWQASR